MLAIMMLAGVRAFLDTFPLLAFTKIQSSTPKTVALADISCQPTALIVYWNSVL